MVTRDEDVPAGEGLRVHRGITPRSEELRRLYNDADVFALPTYADAVPNVVVEAMAAGLPVVATDVGAVREMVGDAGVVVPRGDVDALGRRARRAAQRSRAARRSRREGPGACAPALRVHDPGGAPGGVAERARPRAGGRMLSRRRLLVLGGATVVAAAAAPYVVLAPGDEFEEFVADAIGMDFEQTVQLLERVRNEYGTPEYEARAAAFALALRDPGRGDRAGRLPRVRHQGVPRPDVRDAGRHARVRDEAREPGCRAVRRARPRVMQVADADLVVVGWGSQPFSPHGLR